jgi:hypothetical protein
MDIYKIIKQSYHFGRDNGVGRSDKNLNDFIEKPEIKKLISSSVVSRYDEMVFKPPFRVGRKQGKAVVDSNGLLVTFFQESESQALLFCDYLNHKF